MGSLSRGSFKKSQVILICSWDWEWLMSVSMCMYIIIRLAWWKYSSIMYLNIFWLTFWTAWWICTKRSQNSLLAIIFNESMMPFLNLSDRIAGTHMSNPRLFLIEGKRVATLASTYLYLSACTQIYAGVECICKIMYHRYLIHLTIILVLHEKYHFINHFLHFLNASWFLVVTKLIATSSFTAISIWWRNAFSSKRRHWKCN